MTNLCVGCKTTPVSEDSPLCPGCQEEAELLPAGVLNQVISVTAWLAMEKRISELERIATELTTENAELRQRIARMEAGGKQTIYAWGE